MARINKKVFYNLEVDLWVICKNKKQNFELSPLLFTFGLEVYGGSLPG